MASKGSGSAPKAPDPWKTASADAQFNRLNTYSPSGSGTLYGYTNPRTGEFVAGVPRKNTQAAVTTVESPWEKQIREILQPASVSLTGRVVSDNIDNMPDAARVQDRADVAQAMFDKSWSMMAPAVEKANSRLLGNLQARGIPVGSAAFNDTMGEQQKQTEATISRLAMDATLNAGQEQSRQYGLDAAQRSAAISEIIAAMGGSYNPPSALPTGGAAGVNYSGMVGDKYQADLAQYQANQQQKSSTASTLGSLAGGLIMKCTESAKDVHGSLQTDLTAEAVLSMPLKVWSYKVGEGDTARHVGPMAEDFQRVTGLGDGKTINIIDAFGVVFGALQDALRRIEVLERRNHGDTVH